MSVINKVSINNTVYNIEDANAIYKDDIEIINSYKEYQLLFNQTIITEADGDTTHYSLDPQLELEFGTTYKVTIDNVVYYLDALLDADSDLYLGEPWITIGGEWYILFNNYDFSIYNSGMGFNETSPTQHTIKIEVPGRDAINLGDLDNIAVGYTYGNTNENIAKIPYKFIEGLAADIPVASESNLGCVKVGTNLSIDSEGILSGEDALLIQDKHVYQGGIDVTNNLKELVNNVPLNTHTENGNYILRGTINSGIVNYDWYKLDYYSGEYEIVG